MQSVVGVFTSRSEAVQGIESLGKLGFSRDRINVLTPASSDEQVAAVPTAESEQPGMGAAVGGVVGGAIGSAGGFGLGAALASFLVPGVGPVLAGGLIGASLLGLGGLAGGAAAGDAVEDKVSGVPRDELYVYEDALRHGRTIVIAQAEDDSEAEAARSGLAKAGAETIDAARDKWWIGLRSAELENYQEPSDEENYRRGFEAAQSHALRGKSYEEALAYLSPRDEAVAKRPGFRKGYENGQRYRAGLS